MKELIKKVVVISILMILAINSQLLLIISEAAEAIEEMMEKAEITPMYEMDLKKYVNYSTKNSTGTLLQINLKTKVEYGEKREHNPFSSMGILLKAPKIEEEYPENVEIIAKTSGNTEETFKSSYDQETGEIKIVAIKEQEEYDIIFYYGSNCYKDNNEERSIEISGIIQANIADDNQTQREAEIKQTYTVTENQSGLISSNVYTSDIYNGYIDSNNQNNTTYQTEYKENLEIDISQKEIADEIIINTQHNFINKNDETIETEEIIYQATKVDKNQILAILGEEGYLRILNENGEILAEINKDTEVGENGIYEINYENEVSKITIQTSKPLKVGTILLQNTKSIKETMKDIDINRIEEKNIFHSIEKTKETKKVIDPETNEEKEEVEEHAEEIYQYENNHIAEIKESETKINLSVDKTDWTNNMQNDVTFNAKLIANQVQYKLAKNPSLEIKLPEEVEKVVLGNVSLLYGNGLTVANAEVIENENGKFIRVEIAGNQTEYLFDSIVTGANILIPATIILKQDIESVKRNISWTYINDNIGENGAEETEINIESIVVKPAEEEIAPEVVDEARIMTTTEPTVEPIENENQRIQVQANEINEDDLEINVQAQIGDQQLQERDTVRERQIIKYSVTLTNKSTEKITGITVEGQVPEGTTYATVDMGTYIQEAYDYIKNEDVKACTVPISEIESGKSKTVFYEVVVEDLAEGVTEKNIANTITTKINDNVYHQETKNNVIKKAEFETRVKCYMGREGRNSFYYYFDITNLSGKDINNVQIETSQIQKELSLVKAAFYDHSLDEIGAINENNQYVAQIDKINAGETRTILLIMSANNYDDYVNEVPLRMTVKVRGDNTATYISNEARRNGYPEYVTISQTLDKEGENVKVGDKVEYKYVIKNESKVRTIVQILDKYSEFLEDVTVKYDMYNILSYTEGEQASSDTFYDLEEEANLKYEREPRELIVSELVNHNVFDTTMVIPAGKTLEITVTGIAADVDKTTEVQNYMVVSGPDIKTRSSNISKFYIYVEEPKEPLDPDDEKPKEPVEPEIPDIPYDPFEPEYPDYPYNPDDPNISYNNKVSGMVWLDKNKDGIKQSDEETLKDISVKLYNASNNSMVDNGTYTNDNGEYEFTNISKGNYLVLFEYDTEKYTTTKFTQYGGNQNSSNAMKKTATIDGQEKTVAMTDILAINQSNIENLNLGLIENSTFDLKLDKYINQITVKNNKTKTYKYNNSQLAKIEIPAKQIENTQVEIEYKIVVTNEGNVEAYADEIIDYLPKDLQISNNTKDTAWTKDAKGNLLNRSLIGEKIQPGESKELKLVVTKKMSSQNTGNVLNAAEINMSKSIDNLKDVDSTAGNKKVDEDDYSEASVIISINTGLVRNIIIFIVIVGLIAFIIIVMKNVKNKKMFAFILSLVLFTCLSNSVQALNIKGNRNVPFIGDDNNRYVCISPGQAQCAGGDHFYEVMRRANSTDDCFP